MGFRGRVARSTLADANESHDWRIFADFAQVLIRIARPLYAADPIGVDLDHSLYALDSTTIDLCLSLFPWAKFRKHKAAVKMHTLLDLHGNIPTFIRITDGKVHDVNILDEIYPGGRRVLRHGSRLRRFRAPLRLHAQRGLLRRAHQIQRLAPAPLLASGGQGHRRSLRSHRHPDRHRVGQGVPGCVAARELSSTWKPDKRFKFLTNNFTLPALTIAQIYKCRWQVELFFKWIKQHLRIKAFYGTSENAVKTQIWIAVSVYVLVAIVRKRLGLEASLYQILQILSVTLFEKTPILQALQASDSENDLVDSGNQLILFDF